MERKGILTRSHGGALAAENPLPATRAAASALPVEDSQGSFQHRTLLHSEGKMRVARNAGTPFDAPRCGIDHLALEVSDLDAVQQRLAALGYPLDEGPIEEDNVRFLLIRGPDGERLEFDACKR